MKCAGAAGRRIIACAFLASAPLVASTAAGTDASKVVLGKPARAVQKDLRSGTLSFDPHAGAVAVKVRLPAISADESKRWQSPQEKRVRIGVSRDAADAWAGQRLRWVTAADGGSASRIEVESEGASALKTGLAIRSMPAAGEIRVTSAGNSQRVHAVAGSKAVEASRSQGVYWTPLTDGASQWVEIRLPRGVDTSSVSVSIEAVSHVFASPANGFKSTGASQACHLDVVCTARGNEALARASRSVAKLVYVDNGLTYMCTGTLVNDGDVRSEVPYMNTAAHCLRSQAAAATLETFWFFESSQCGARGPGDYRQLTGGSTLLYSNAATDVALVRLHDAAPEGSWFSGWDASPVSSGQPVVSVHHPRGDLKKLSVGKSLEGGGAYTQVEWLAGSTEPGSSGSGLFTLAGNEYVLRGALRGGPASCESSGRSGDPGNRDHYSRFEGDAEQLGKLLRAPAAPAYDYTDMWWNPERPGWGLSVIQHSDNKLFVTWFTYDEEGAATWLVVPAPQWRTVSVAEGTVYRATGAPSPRAHEATLGSLEPLGVARLEFTSRDGGIFSATLGAQVVTQPIRRQAFQ